MKAPTRILACTVVTLMLIGTAVILGAGGGSAELTAPAKPVRAVSVMYLNRSCPVQTQTMTGSVASWKTEQVGFEVAGRVLQVLEPGAEIEGRVLDQATGAVLSEGTVLARLDDQRYRITAEIAQAALDVAQRQRDAIQVEIEQSLPARLEAARAEQKLAQGELARTQELVSRNAISRSEFDRVQTTLETATANVAIRQAELAAKQAEHNSAAAQVEQARLRLEEAERDREDTILHAPFRGQVAKVHVVAGSYVAVGAPVLTVQMMDPIQIELELSATMSRRFRFGDAIRIVADGPDWIPGGGVGNRPPHRPRRGRRYADVYGDAVGPQSEGPLALRIGHVRRPAGPHAGYLAPECGTDCRRWHGVTGGKTCHSS